MSKPALIGGIGESPLSFFENRDLSNLEKPIRFSFRNCSIEKDYCIRPLDNTEIKHFYERLDMFENITWKQVWNMGHEKGFSSEKKDSGNYSFLKKTFSLFSSFLHFRVNGTRSGVFRVFAAQDGDMCRLLLLDRDGKINHK